MICGIPIAFIAYGWESRQARTDAALSYLNRFNSDSILEARNRLYLFWRNQDPNTFRGMTLADFNRFVETAISETPPRSHEIPLINIIDFFDGLQACIESRVCDAPVLEGQIAGYAANLWCNYEGFILSRRGQAQGGLPQLGRGLERFTLPHRQC